MPEGARRNGVPLQAFSKNASYKESTKVDNLSSISDILIESDEIEKIVKPKIKIESSNKQIELCSEMVNEHNYNISDYEYYFSEYEDYMFQYTNIINKIKMEISCIKIYNNTSTNEYESFDKSKHDLLITKDRNNEWEFIYIRKTDRIKFQKIMKSSL